MSRALDGRRALITGATANIGAATARLFAQEGARLVLVDRDPAIEDTAASIRESGGDASAVVADVSSADAVDALAQVVDERLGGLDVLVNNAAIQRVGPVESIRVEEWDLGGAGVAEDARDPEPPQERERLVPNRPSGGVPALRGAPVLRCAHGRTGGALHALAHVTPPSTAST
jgi:hypothetical protein